MSYTEQLFDYAKSKEIDTEALTKDLEKVTELTGMSVEYIAYSCITLIEWDKKEASSDRYQHAKLRGTSPVRGELTA